MKITITVICNDSVQVCNKIGDLLADMVVKNDVDSYKISRVKRIKMKKKVEPSKELIKDLNFLLKRQ